MLLLPSIHYKRPLKSVLLLMMCNFCVYQAYMVMYHMILALDHVITMNYLLSYYYKYLYMCYCLYLICTCAIISYVFIPYLYICYYQIFLKDDGMSDHSDSDYTEYARLTSASYALQAVKHLYHKITIEQVFDAVIVITQ